MKILSLLIALLAGATALKAQTANDPSITALSVMGVVSELKSDTRQVIVTTAAGSQVVVTLSDRTVFMRIPPGEKTKDKFIRIAPTDFAVGDSVFARGRMTDDRKSMPALEFYVMSKGEIAEKKERERSEWSKRGIAGTVSAVNAETKEITIDGPKPIVVATSAETKFRRYAPDSVRFSDAQPATFADVKVGDQLRALGTADGARFTPEEIVSGSFQTISGTITEVDAEKKEIKIRDITIAISKDTSLRRLTPEMIAALTGPAKSDLQEKFDQLPGFTIAELKVGDAIVVSSSKGTDPSRIKAIAVVSGVEPLLQNKTARATTISLGSMSLGGP
jgi:ribosomal protein L24